LNPESGQATELPGGKKNPPYTSPSPCRARQGLQRERKRREEKKRERIERNEETIGDILAAEAPLQALRRSDKSHEINFPVTTSRLP